MKHKKNQSRLVSLLIRGYLGFAAVMVILAVFSTWISDVYFQKLMSFPNVEGLSQDQALLEGRYGDIRQGKYLSKGDWFAVVEEDGTPIYFSSETIKEVLGVNFTRQELDCIQSYDENTYIEAIPFTNEDGEKYYILIKYDYSGEEAVERAVVLDQDYRVIYGTIDDDNDREVYTEREFAFLTGTMEEDYDIIKYVLPETGETESERLLIVLSRGFTMDRYNMITRKSDSLLLLVIPLFLLAMAAFVMWLNKEIQNPLAKVNLAIDSLSSGGDGRVGEIKGPVEIQNIGINFDHMADLLAESERQRKQMDEERQKMLADISHDLKTPITVISGYTKALKDGKIPPEKAAGYLELIDSKAEELTGLVNSFHQFSVTSHPAFMLQTETCDLCEFMRSYLADRYDEIDLAGFCIHVMIPETKLVCNLDRPQMRRALDNIVYNALKYNRLGTELTFAVFPVEKVIGGEKSARIVIADNGIGIPPSKRESIFEPFVQGDESRGSGGSGLGLSITKRIVQAHCGSICCCMPSEIREAELTFSAGSGGTAFEILLPLTTCAEEL